MQRQTILGTLLRVRTLSRVFSWYSFNEILQDTALPDIKCVLPYFHTTQAKKTYICFTKTMKLRAYMTGVERGRVGQKGGKGEDLGIGGDDKGWCSLRRPIFHFLPSFFLACHVDYPSAYFCPLLSLFDRKLFQETRNLDSTRPVTFVTMFKAWSDKVVRKRRFKR